jgi:hypothetical protein
MVYAPRRRTRRHTPGYTPKPDRTRALELLAGCGPDGCTEGLCSPGSRWTSWFDLICAGLASAAAERGVMGPKTIEVARVRITEAGRRELQPR